MFYRKKEHFVDVTIYDYNLVLLEKDKIIEEISNELDIFKENIMKQI